MEGNQVAGEKILLVEDEIDIQQLINLHLKREGYEVDIAADGDRAMELLDGKEFDLLILDWMLPGLSGLDIAHRVRQGSVKGSIKRTVPILMVTAKAESHDIVEGLEGGADDYLTKPFEVDVLKARVAALLRRAMMSESAPVDENMIAMGSIKIDMAGHEVFQNGEKLHLTVSEFRLLAELASNQGRVLTRDHLIRIIQGGEIAVTHRTIDTHVFGLRKKLGEEAGLIETIRGVGYRVPIVS